MKTTIYTLTTNDDGQMDTSFFDTEEARDAEIRGLLQEHLGDDWAAVWTDTGDDVEALYSVAQEDYGYEIDLHWTEHEIDLPTEPVNAGLLAALRMVSNKLDRMLNDENGDVSQTAGDALSELEDEVNAAIVAALGPAIAAAESPAPMENAAKTRVFVRVYGGSVQSIASDMPSAIEAFIIDEDNDSPKWSKVNIDPERQSIADQIVFAAGKA